MSPPRYALVLALTACGRLQFDDTTPDGSGDASGDARNDCYVNHPAALFCDGFEDGFTPWDYPTVHFATIDATTTRARTGTHALEASTDGSANIKDARWGAYFGVAIKTGDIYVRQYIWLPSSVSIVGQVSLLVAANGQPPYPSTFYMLEPGMLIISSDGTQYNFTDNLPRDRWVCAELQIHIDPAVGFVRLAFDSITSAQTAAIDTDLVGGYTNIDAGIHYASAAQPPVSLWIDDIVVDTSPIGCN